MKLSSFMPRAIWVFLLFLPSMALRAQTVAFVPQDQVFTGAQPDALVLAPLSGNLQSNLMVANGGDSSLSVLRNLGNGLFSPFVIQPTGAGPRAIVVADFNRDGRLDAAVANSASNRVTVLLGNGNGTFYFLINLSVGAPVALAAADFNGDGKLDLAVVSNNSNKVSIFLGNGNGTFNSFSTAATGSQPNAIALADFNGDGKLDLAVPNAGSNDVSVLLGNGNGTFQAARTFPAGPSPSYLALGDFNGDGLIDLAVANAVGPSGGSISMLLGLGNGNFVSPRTFIGAANPSFLVTGDFNLDGNMDLAVANTGSNSISIFLGIGDGSFGPPLNFTAGSAPAWITVADLNGDGKPDLLVANRGSNSVSVLINRTGAVVAPVVTSAPNAAALQAGPVAPGELVTVFGSNLGPAVAAQLQFSASGLVATQLAQTQVLFDGIPAPVLYAASGQVTAVVPFGVAGRQSTQLVVSNAGQMSAPLTLRVAGSSPAIFTIDSSGQGQGAILNQDGSINGAMNPAAEGSVVVLYATGAGQTNPAGVDGLLATAVLPSPMLAVSVSIDGRPAQVLYAGAAPGMVAGVLQVNVQLPSGIRSGLVAVSLQVGAAASQPGVTLAVQ
jgi:uncharacterized protein (TIGR03437 family)